MAKVRDQGVTHNRVLVSALTHRKQCKKNYFKPKCANFQVKRIYYDQIAAGTKKTEIRAWKPYWISRLMPAKGHMPDVAIFHTPGRPIIRFEILDISYYHTEALIGEGILTEAEFNEFINTDTCIVTFLGDRIETTKGQLTWGDFK